MAKPTDDGLCWIKGCQRKKGHQGDCSVDGEPSGDVSIWMVRGKDDGRWIYFYPGNTRMDVYDGIMERARREGFRGTIQERLQQLGWEVVPMKARLDLATPENRKTE